MVVCNLGYGEFRGHSKLGYIRARFGRLLGRDFYANPATVCAWSKVASE